jgi:hypothetical protein
MVAAVAASTPAAMPVEIAPHDVVDDRWKRLTGVDADNPRDRQSVVAVDRRARRSSGALILDDGEGARGRERLCIDA